MYSVNFISSNPVFCQPLVQELSSKYNVRTFFGKNVQDVDTFLECKEQMRDSDVNWIDFCDPLALEMMRGIKTSKTIVRLHSYEFFDGMCDHLNLDNVDRLVFVNDSLSNMIHYRIPISTKKIKVIYNAVDLRKFAIQPRERQNRVGIAGFINHKKDPTFAFNCFYEMHKHMPDTEFVWAGQHQDIRYHLDMIHMMSKIPFKLSMLPWQNDMNQFLNTCDFILSSSLFESCHLSVLEGMACGCIPLVRGWRGAENIYPLHSLFTFPDQCGNKFALFHTDSIFGMNRGEFMMKNREWVQKYFSFEKHIEQVDALIGEVIHG